MEFITVHFEKCVKQMLPTITTPQEKWYFNISFVFCSFKTTHLM